MQYILIWASLIYLTATQTSTQAQAAPPCITIKSISGYILKDHVIYTIKGKSLDTCVTQCANDEKCFSINYSHTTRICEVNRQSRGTNPCDLKPSNDDTVYMDSLQRFQKNACALTPCRNGGTCVVTSSCVGYVCDCGPYFKGPNCKDCTSLGAPLGMESKRIPDKFITASTFEPSFPPYSGRLNHKGWIALESDKNNPYFQVQLKHVKLISRVRLSGVQAILGKKNISACIEDMFFSYSLDGQRFIDYVKPDRDREFKALSECDKELEIAFSSPIKAKYLRIRPVNFKQRPAIRMELYGCEVT